MSRRPGGRTNGAGRAPRPSRPRGSNKGPTSGGCGRVIALVLLLPLVSLLADCIIQAGPR